MWIIKIGGSLQDSEYLRPWLEAVIEHGRGRVVVVPGGGRFADAVREAQRRFGFDDGEAHRAAVRAMEKYATLLHEHTPQLTPVRNRGETLNVLEHGGVPLWLPFEMVIDNPELPQSWTVTSDSLALWLAQHLSAQGLALVKSVEVEEAVSLDELAADGVIDAFFPQLFQIQSVNLAWFTAGNAVDLKDLLDYGVPRISDKTTSPGSHPADASIISLNRA